MVPVGPLSLGAAVPQDPLEHQLPDPPPLRQRREAVPEAQDRESLHPRPFPELPDPIDGPVAGRSPVPVIPPGRAGE